MPPLLSVVPGARFWQGSGGRPMANQSQCLDDAPFRGFLRCWEPSPPQAYSEAQRLALEELIAGGRAAFRAFLRREEMRAFLSEPEIQAILRAAVPPPGAEENSSSAGADQPLNGSLDCSSLTYFPVQSDVEPPVLELGWPAFVSGSFRGLTRVETHFQPSFGETVYPCKEAVRKQIRSAREVIALVMDFFTDSDIFSDLLEVCRKREVKVYILLDQVTFPYFLKMCKDLGVELEQEKFLRVRSITGRTFYTRSGIKLLGKAREKFMLVDGIRVTTGSYSFIWTDGNLSSSNILILSGPEVAQFRRRFRILYAQSKLVNTKMLVACKNARVEQFFRKVMPSNELCERNILRMDFFYLRAFAENVKDKQAFSRVSWDTRCDSDIVVNVPPPVTKRKHSVFIRAQRSIRW
ncbi:protein FAM83D-B-like [Hemicordylus capensis]|uniref:protein FAM83D-B-like n=1 Tax=Hemicordylus capensis TaxID=884348 RepID=UPI0023041E93|nr:protein FAM83D-B-like [Hemicordylus capensis]